MENIKGDILYNIGTRNFKCIYPLMFVTFLLVLASLLSIGIKTGKCNGIGDVFCSLFLSFFYMMPQLFFYFNYIYPMLKDKDNQMKITSKELLFESKNGKIFSLWDDVKECYTDFVRIDRYTTKNILTIVKKDSRYLKIDFTALDINYHKFADILKNIASENNFNFESKNLQSGKVEYYTLSILFQFVFILAPIFLFFFIIIYNLI